MKAIVLVRWGGVGGSSLRTPCVLKDGYLTVARRGRNIAHVFNSGAAAYAKIDKTVKYWRQCYLQRKYIPTPYSNTVAEWRRCFFVVYLKNSRE